jgi:hypothetical protein
MRTPNSFPSATGQIHHFFLYLAIITIPLCTAQRVIAQSPKELVQEAAINELRQLESEGLWECEVERQTGGHVFIEHEIETVDGPVDRLLLVDGHPPSEAERRNNDMALHNLEHNSSARTKLRKKYLDDEKAFRDLVQEIPEEYLFDLDGHEGTIRRLTFRPDPAYQPKSYGARIAHAMSGYLLIDEKERRLVEFSAVTIQQVDFGFGLVGRVGKGTTVEFKRIQVAPGIWKKTSSTTKMSGRILLFKSVDKQMIEKKTDWKPMPREMSISMAVKQLGLP